MEVLVGDIGGTNTDLGIADTEEMEIVFSVERGTDENEVMTHIKEFIEEAEEKGYEVDQGCIAVAGPLEDGCVEMPNTDITVEKERIEKNTGLKEVHLINDFDAIGYAINCLSEDDYKTVQDGREEEKAAKTVIGAGTGLGKDILVYDRHIDSYIPSSSEGAHADLPIKSEEEFELLKFLEQKKDINNVSYEDVISGHGLENIYSYLRQEKFSGAEKNLSAKEIARTKDSNKCSRRTFNFFIRFYARCAKNLALDAYSRGGVYIAGGITAKNPEEFNERFLDEFSNADPQFSSILEEVPIKLITNYKISLKGAAYAFKVREDI